MRKKMTEPVTLNPVDALLRQISRQALVVAQLETLCDHLQARIEQLTQEANRELTTDELAD
jgi:hypothetical protein